ncbi:UBX domain-containing protein 1 [Arapaima gigas]
MQHQYQPVQGGRQQRGLFGTVFHEGKTASLLGESKRRVPGGGVGQSLLGRQCRAGGRDVPAEPPYRKRRLLLEMAECTTLDSLLEMGFDRNRAEKAVAHTGNQGIERAMDWLMEHENDPDIDEPYVPPAGNVLGSTDSPQAQDQLPSDLTAEVSQMTQGGEGKRPMTEEEKKEQIKRLEELMRVKQEERRERERQEEVEREKQRRKQGQELLQIKQKLQEEEMKKLAEQRRREKMEDRIARQKVREKIARDREERAQKFGGGAASSAAAASEASPSSSPCSQGPPPAKKDYDECRIQVRLLDGSTLTSVFKAQEPLAAVRVYVQMNGGDSEDFTLLTPYPRRVFTELDMEKPLRELGLVPSAVLVVAKK